MCGKNDFIFNSKLRKHLLLHTNAQLPSLTFPDFFVVNRFELGQTLYNAVPTISWLAHIGMHITYPNSHMLTEYLSFDILVFKHFLDRFFQTHKQHTRRRNSSVKKLNTPVIGSIRSEREQTLVMEFWQGKPHAWL